MELILFLCGGLFSLMFYFLPTFIAMMRRHPNAVAILIINLFLGWSLIGWVVSLAWSFTAVDK